MTGHFLALEDTTRILTLTGRTVAAVRNRHTVRRAKAAEVVPLHRTLKALTDRRAGHVDELTFEVMVGGDFLAHVDQVFRINTELSDLPLRFNLGHGEVATHGLARPLGLGSTGTKLNSRIAVFLSGAVGHNLKSVKLKNGHRNLLAVFHEQPGHPDLFCNNARAQHERCPP